MIESVRRELVLLAANKANLLHWGLYGVTSILVGAMAMPQGNRELEFAMGLYWIVMLFVSVLMLAEVYRLDFDSYAWQRFRVHGKVFEWLVGKIIVLPLVAAAVSVLVAVATIFFASIELKDGFWYLVPITWAAILGVFCAGLVVLPLAEATGRRALMLPLLLFPLSFPIWLSAIQLHQSIMEQSLSLRWLGWLLVIDSIYAGVAMLVIDQVVSSE